MNCYPAIRSFQCCDARNLPRSRFLASVKKLNRGRPTAPAEGPGGSADLAADPHPDTTTAPTPAPAEGPGGVRWPVPPNHPRPHNRPDAQPAGGRRGRTAPSSPHGPSRVGRPKRQRRGQEGRRPLPPTPPGQQPPRRTAPAEGQWSSASIARPQHQPTGPAWAAHPCARRRHPCTQPLT